MLSSARAAAAVLRTTKTPRTISQLALLPPLLRQTATPLFAQRRYASSGTGNALPESSDSVKGGGRKPPIGKGRRRLRIAGLVGLAGVSLWAYDKEYNASAFRRSLRTLVFGVTLALDFKLNFDPNDADKIDRIHERTAQRLSRLVDQNVGMYVKLAQALAIQAAILPKPYREAFANVFDGAPAVSWEEVVRVFRNEFGCHPDDAFDSFEREPLASASIAQVHKARLKADPNKPWKEDEGWVAVKIRKEAVPKQMEWCVSPCRSVRRSATTDRLFPGICFAIESSSGATKRSSTSPSPSSVSTCRSRCVRRATCGTRRTTPCGPRVISPTNRP